MNKATRTGLLLINLGTPDAPQPREVGRYLREFLMDPKVIQAPGIIRWLLVNLLIVPRRRHASAALYQKIWLSEGSPLLVYTNRLAQKVQRQLGEGHVVVVGMRYGQPSLQRALEQLIRSSVDRIILFPLYPQFSDATVTTSLQRCQEVLKELNFRGPVVTIPAFYDQPEYVQTVANTVGESRSSFAADHVLFSFHGLPESHIRAADPSGHCLQDSACCESFRAKAPQCYRAQCFATAAGVAQKVGLPASAYSVSFQSRLGPTAWIKPYTEEILLDLAKRGVKNLLIASPAFTADCLETLEELAIRAKEVFVEAGGQDLRLVPSLNDRDDWVDAVCALVRRNP